MKTVVFAVFVTMVLALILTFNFPYYAINPGKISDYHKKLLNNCNDCHNPFNGNQKKCLSCHKLNSIGQLDSINVQKSYYKLKVVKVHQNLNDQICENCHIEHINTLESKKHLQFDHKYIKADISKICESCHASDKPKDDIHKLISQCNTCHTINTWKIGKFDHSEKIIESIKCSFCHTNNKPDDLIHKKDEDCSKCHSTKEWKPSNFDHDRYFVFDEDHPKECVNCHTDKNTYKIYTCYNCHEHNKSKMIAEHAEEGINNIDKCRNCHSTGNKHDANNQNSEFKKHDHERGHDNESKERGSEKKHKENDD